METHPEYCIVLDEAGRVIKTAKMNCQVGQTIDAIREIPARGRKQTNLTRILTIVGSVAACLALALSIYSHITLRNLITPYAAVYLSINPSVKMDVNWDGLVVGLAPEDADGEILLAGYDGLRKDLNQVVDELIDIAFSMGYLSDGGVISIGIDSPDETWFSDIRAALRLHVDKHFAGYVAEDILFTIDIFRYAEHQDDGADDESDNGAEGGQAA